MHRALPGKDSEQLFRDNIAVSFDIDEEYPGFRMDCSHAVLFPEPIRMAFYEYMGAVIVLFLFGKIEAVSLGDNGLKLAFCHVFLGYQDHRNFLLNHIDMNSR